MKCAVLLKTRGSATPGCPAPGVPRLSGIHPTSILDTGHFQIYKWDIVLGERENPTSTNAENLWQNEGLRIEVDEEKKVIVLFREFFASRTFFYRRESEGWAVSNYLELLEPDRRSPQISLTGLDLFLTLGFIPAPFTAFEGISKLPPGTSLRLTGRIPVPIQTSRREASIEKPESLHDLSEELCRRLTSEIADAVQRKERLTISLSGGIDSTLVYLLAREVRGGDFDTVQLIRPGSDDEKRGKAAAKLLGSNHHTSPFPGDCGTEIWKTFAMVDEPVADSSILAWGPLRDHAKQWGNLCLMGIGADDLFGGLYEHKALHHSLSEEPFDIGDGTIKAKAIISRMLRQLQSSPDQATAWKCMISRFSSEKRGRLILGWRTDERNDADTFLNEWFERAPQDLGPFRFAALCRLPNSTLPRLCDFNEESRFHFLSPFASDSVLELSLKLKENFLVTGKESKPVVRRALANRLPSKMWNLPKSGFGLGVTEFLNSQEPIDYLNQNAEQAGLDPIAVIDWTQEFRRSSGSRRHYLASRVWQLLAWVSWFARDEENDIDVAVKYRPESI